MRLIKVAFFIFQVHFAKLTGAEYAFYGLHQGYTTYPLLSHFAEISTKSIVFIAQNCNIYFAI